MDFGRIVVCCGTILEMIFMIFHQCWCNFGYYLGASGYNFRMLAAMNVLRLFENLGPSLPRYPGTWVRIQVPPGTQAPGYRIWLPEYSSTQVPRYYPGTQVPR